jgi:phosphoribosylanthranilate isomerase
VTLVKICGLMRPQDVDATVDEGADLVGFILVEGTPRYLEPDRARALAARVPERVRTVAVVNAGTAPVAGFDLTQTYDTSAHIRDGSGSDPTPQFGANGSEVDRGRDTHVARPGLIVASRGEFPPGVPDGVPVLLDLAFGSRPGAEELRAHWARAAAVRQPVILAGSLDPENVAEAVRAARPWAVDTARGVETAPGVKDHALVRAFIRNAKEAA